MANEFVARKGLIALSNSEVTGSLGISTNTTVLGNIELGHATANTLTASGGVLSIEGNRIFHAGGTDIPVADGGTGVSTSTGTGNVVLSNSPTLVTPALGTPASGVATNLTGTSGITGLGTQTTDLEMGGLNIQTAGVITLKEQAEADADVAGEGQLWVDTATPNVLYFTDDAGTDHRVNFSTSAHLRGMLSDETGTGGAVFATSPTIVTPTIASFANATHDHADAAGGGVIALGTATSGHYVATITGGTGIASTAATTGEGTTHTLSIGQAVATTSDVTFDTGSFTGDVTITGNLLVQGATTQIQTSELKVEDILITVASGSANSTAANGAGIEIDMGGQTNPAMTWGHATQEFDFNYPISSSQITGSYFGDGSGLSNIVSTLTTAGDSGAGTVALKTQTLTVAGTNGITTTAADQGITITVPTAADDTAGLVELATTAETNTGTDAARAVTPDGLNDWTGGAGAITKLGTIASGVWQGTTVAVAQGGTGVTSKTGTGNVVLSTSPTLVTPALGTPASGVATNITGLPIVAGTTGTLTVARGGTGATTLNNLITMGTHTTGDYVATVTAGTGLTSTGATSGESIAHSLSVDAAQTQITSVGTLAAGAISSGFGAIDIGSSALTAGSATVASATVASTNISGSSVSVATGGSETTAVIATVATASYASAQFDYSVQDGTNYRAGTVVSVWKPFTGTIQFTDFSTPDIGNTSDATFTMDGSLANARLKFTSSAGTWTVKVSVRAF